MFIFGSYLFVSLAKDTPKAMPLLHFAPKSSTAVSEMPGVIVPLLTIQKVVTKPVEMKVAHENHYEVDHNELVDSESGAIEENTSTFGETDSESEITSPKQLVGDSLDSNAAIQEVPVSQPVASVTEAGLFGGISLGVGEMLFALIIATPFFLIVSKRKLHSSKHFTAARKR